MAKPDETPTAAVSSAPVTETPEFKAALKEAEAKLEAKFTAMAEEFGKKLQATAATIPAPAGADLTSILSTLALEIGKVSDQGTDRKRVAPEEIAARDAAFERMGKLLEEAQALPQAEWPRYKLVAKTLLNDRVINPINRNSKNELEQVHILHRGIPNMAMRPVDDRAKAIYKEWVRHLGGSEAANSIAPSSPLWMTTKGTVLANPTESARKFGQDFNPDPILIDGEELPSAKLAQTAELISPLDPRATEHKVLGTIADTAKVGQVSSRVV